MQVSRGLQAAWRRRELAGDHRAGTWTRRRARKAHLRVIRRTWKLLLLIGVGAGVLSGACLWFIPNTVVRSYCAGLLTAGIIGALAFQVTQMAGTSGIAMGEIAEQWTAQELRKLRRKGWRVVNHLMLRAWDIDHVLVGPGGIFAVETKWSAQPWKLDPLDDRILAATRQVTGNARDLSLWHPLKAACGQSARGVVVVWGHAADGQTVDKPLRSGEVEIVTAKTIELWCNSLPATGLTESQVDACWRALEDQVRVRDRLADPPPGNPRKPWRHAL